MKAIRSLSVGKLSTTQLQADAFLDFGLELEDLKLAHASIDSIKSHAFKNVRGVRRLDLSENRISQIDNDAFAEVSTNSIFLFQNLNGICANWRYVVLCLLTFRSSRLDIR